MLADVERGEHPLEVIGRQGDVDFAGERAIRAGEPSGENHNPLLGQPAQFRFGYHQARVWMLLKLAKILAVGDIDALRRVLKGSVKHVAVGVDDAQPRRLRQARRLTIEQSLERCVVDRAGSALTLIFVRRCLQNDVDLRKCPVEAGVERAAEILRVGPRMTAFVGAVIDEKEGNERRDDDVERDERKNDALTQHVKRPRSLASAAHPPTNFTP
jgi:hypothetical protein